MNRRAVCSPSGGTAPVVDWARCGNGRH